MHKVTTVSSLDIFKGTTLMQIKQKKVINV